MSYIQGKSGLFLPQQHSQMSKARDISAQAIEHWRSQLPLADLTSSTRAIYVTLQDIHQAPIKARERFEILSLLRPTLSYLCQTLQKFYLSQEILTENQQQIADLIFALQFEMVNGYKIIIDELYSKFFGNKTLLLAAFQGALHYLTKILLQAYEQHRPSSPGIWRELHIIFHLAEQKRLANKSLPKLLEWNSNLTTLQDVYKACLLFVLSNPQRLRRAEMTHLSFVLEEWAPLLILKKTYSNDLFKVDFNRDGPPHYTEPDQKNASTLYFLSMEKINKRLIKLFAAKKNNSNKERISFSEAELKLPLHFIDSLLTSWQHLNERDHVRQKAQGHIAVCLGIQASHWFIDNQQFSTNVIKSNLESNFSHPSKSQSHKFYQCELVDKSEGGCCLKWLQDIPSQLQCGEIIAFENVINSKKNWVIGTIRWLRHEKDHSIHMGVQLLSSSTMAVTAYVTDTSSANGIPSLLLPESASHKPATLITSTLPFKNNQNIKLECSLKNFEVHLRQSISTSPSYQEFELEFTDELIDFSELAKMREQGMGNSSSVF